MGKTIAVVGGGISGIATAYFLKKKKYNVEILEFRSKLGGRTSSMNLNDKMIDIGGKNIGRHYPLFRTFLQEMGDYELEFFGINSSIIIDNSIHTIDSEKKFSSILSFMKIMELPSFIKFMRLSLHVKLKRENGYLDSNYFNKLSEKYDHVSVSHHFGANFINNFLRPVLIRMNGCEPEEYFLGNLGSNIKMVLDTYDQLKCGMHNLMMDVMKSFIVRTDTHVEGIIKTHDSVSGVMIKTHAGSEPHFYDGVILATPAIITSRIIKDTIPDLAVELDKVQYNPVTVAVVKYKKNIFNPKIRAIVFNQNTELSNAGCYGVHDLNIIRYTLSGKKAKETIKEDSQPDFVVSLAEKTLNRYVPVSKELRNGYSYKHFQLGLCSYSSYHHKLLKNIRVKMSTIPGLAVTGDYFRGTSLEACFKAAQETVDEFDKKMKHSHSYHV